MQTGNNDMDKKLRQLENQSLPDLSKQDQHWQQMRQLLQPAAVPAGTQKNWLKKWGIWLAAACIFSIVVIIGYLAIIRSKEDKTVVRKTILPVQTEPLSNNDTAQHPPVITPEEKKTLTGDIKRQVFTTQVTYQVSRDTIMPVPDVTNQPVISKKETVTLAGFFQQLEKETQEFVIRPGQDTLVQGAEGTVLMIPANTFDTKLAITIILREFYSNEDIIANKLSTMSNGGQLISGGMIQVLAIAGGKRIDIKPGKNIRWFIPDTSAAMKGMQLFVDGSQAAAVKRNNTNADVDTLAMSDTAAPRRTGQSINWVPREQMFVTTYMQKMVKVYDLKNNPYKGKETKKGTVGKFRMSPSSKISTAELEQELKAKYGYYKVKVREWAGDRNRRKARFTNPGLSGMDYWSAYDDVGDSAWVKPEVARYFNLAPTDSVTYPVSSYRFVSNAYVKSAFTNIDLDMLTDRFSVDITTLGWVNCDRFYRDSREKVTYTVDIRDTATNYYTVLVFEKIKSIMTGTISGNKVIFPGIPKGEPAKIMCVGIRDNKTVMAIEPLPAEATKIENLKFEETSPASFRQQAAMIDK